MDTYTTKQKILSGFCLFVAISSFFVALITLPAVLFIGLGLIWVIPFSMLGVYSLRLRKQLLGKLPASNENLNAVVTIGLICSVPGATGITMPVSVFFGDVIAMLVGLFTLLTGVTLALLQYFAAKRSLAYLATQESTTIPVLPSVKPQRTTPDWIWALAFSLLASMMALGFSPILLGNLEFYFMQQYWYDGTSYAATTRDLPYVIGALGGVIVFTLTILIRRDTRKKATKLSQTANYTGTKTSVK